MQRRRFKRKQKKTKVNNRGSQRERARRLVCFPVTDSPPTGRTEGDLDGVDESVLLCFSSAARRGGPVTPSRPLGKRSSERRSGKGAFHIAWNESM